MLRCTCSNGAAQAAAALDAVRGEALLVGVDVDVAAKVPDDADGWPLEAESPRRLRHAQSEAAAQCAVVTPGAGGSGSGAEKQGLDLKLDLDLEDRLEWHKHPEDPEPVNELKK